MRELEETLSEIKTLQQDQIGEETMTEEQKERILKKAMQKIDMTSKEPKQGTSTVKPVSVKKTVIRIWPRVAAVILAAVLIPGTAAYAAHRLHWDDKIAAFFGRSQEEDAEVADNIQEVNKSAEVEGITATVTQVLGDESGFYALLRVSGISEELKDQIQYQPVSFRECAMDIDGENVSISGLIDMGTDFDTGDYCYMVKVNTPDVLHTDAKLELDDFGITSEDSFETLCEGEWTIAWTLDYGNTAISYAVDKTLDTAAGTYVWESVSVSPISATVRVHAADTGANELPDVKNSFYVDFADGSRLDAQYLSNADFYQQPGMAVISFDKIHQPEDVVSVTFAGETYLIDEEKLQEKVLYENEEMGFSLQMSQELYAITTVKTTDYHDDDFDADGRKAVFTMTKNGVSMDAFTIMEIDAAYTQEDAEVCNPMAYYLKTEAGKTYLLLYGEFLEEDQMDEFADILNRDVASIMYFFRLTQKTES